MRDIGRCELFSKLCGGDVPCSYPDHKRCSFRFYTNTEGITMGLCSSRVKVLGFKKCWEEMQILLGWSFKRDKCWETELQGKKN